MSSIGTWPIIVPATKHSSEMNRTLCRAIASTTRSRRGPRARVCADTTIMSAHRSLRSAFTSPTDRSGLICWSARIDWSASSSRWTMNIVRHPFGAARFLTT